MSNFSQKTMRRIYVIWLFRQMFNATTFKLGAIALLGWQLVARVSLANVWANWQAKGDIASSLTFFQSALTETEFAVQLALAGIAIASVLVTRDIAKNLRHKEDAPAI